MHQYCEVLVNKSNTLRRKQTVICLPFHQDSTNRGTSGSPRASNRSTTANVTSVMPMQSGTKKIDPSMKGVYTGRAVIVFQMIFSLLLVTSLARPPFRREPKRSCHPLSLGNSHLSCLKLAWFWFLYFFFYPLQYQYLFLSRLKFWYLG